MNKSIIIVVILLLPITYGFQVHPTNISIESLPHITEFYVSEESIIETDCHAVLNDSSVTFPNISYDVSDCVIYLHSKRGLESVKVPVIIGSKFVANSTSATKGDVPFENMTSNIVLFEKPTPQNRISAFFTGSKENFSFNPNTIMSILFVICFVVIIFWLVPKK